MMRMEPGLEKMAPINFHFVPVCQFLEIPRDSMIPGLYAFEMIVLFNRGRVLDALQAAALFGFVIGALAMGLAAARVFNR